MSDRNSSIATSTAAAQSCQAKEGTPGRISETESHERIRALHDIDTAITSTLDLASVLNVLLEKIDRLFSYSVATTVKLLNTDGEPEPVICRNFDEAVWQRGKWQVGHGPANRILKSKRPLIIERLQRDAMVRDHDFFVRNSLVSYFGVPLIAQGKILGVLGFYSKESGRPNDEDIEFITTLAGQAAVAIFNSCLYEETKRQAAQLQRVNHDLRKKEEIQRLLKEMSQDITVLSFDSLLKKVVENVRSVLNVDVSFVRVVENGVWRFLGTPGMNPRRPESSGKGRSAWILKTRRPLAIRDITRVEAPRGEALERRGFHGYLGVPLFSRGGNVKGILTALTYQPRDFTQEDTDLLQLLANGLAVAMENATLFEKATKQARELETLVKINNDIATLLNRDKLLPTIADEARKILNVDNVSFRLAEGESLGMVAQAGEGIDLRSSLRLGESISGRIVNENRPVAIKNLIDEPSLIEEHREILNRSGYRSFLGVPLRRGESAIGTINLFSKKEREFSGEEIHLITAFADQAAIAVENSRLFTEVHEASRAKSEFMAAMSHELRTPLNVVIGFIDLVRDGCFGEINEKIRDALDKSLRNAKVLLKMINDVLTLTRIEAKKMTLDISVFNVEDVLFHVRTYADQLNKSRRLAIDWQVDDPLPQITTDPLKLEEILENLVGNAFKFTSEGKIEIRVRNLKGQDQLEFAVTDTGIGISKDDLEKIFDAFHQLKDAHTVDYNGVGLGLNIVKKYLDLMQGEIRVQSQEGKGTSFAFTLPHSVSANATAPV